MNQGILVRLTNVEDTFTLAASLAPHLDAGDLLLLNGDLGAGKTTFTKALAKSLGVKQTVTSPTFTIMKQYATERSKVKLTHVDAYRITGADDLETIDLERELPHSITVIEWADRILDYLPEHYLRLDFMFPPDPGLEQIRLLKISFSPTRGFACLGSSDELLASPSALGWSSSFDTKWSSSSPPTAEGVQEFLRGFVENNHE